MEYSFLIRRAEPVRADAEAISSIMQEAFRKYMEDTHLSALAHVRMEALDETVEDIIRDIREKYVFIAFLDGEPVGSIRVSVDRERREAYISRFGVCVGRQNMGIGKAFMALIDHLMRDEGIGRVRLHAASRYTQLIRFYYGCGFYIVSTSEERGYIRALLCKDYACNNQEGGENE